MILFSEILLALASIGMARWQKAIIGDQEKIYHGLWAAIAGALILVAAYLVRGDLVSGEYDPTDDGFLLWVWAFILYLRKALLYGFAQACLRPVVFNTALYRFRGLPWDYVSTQTTSVIDRIERRVFGKRAWVCEFILLVFFLIAQLYL